MAGAPKLKMYRLPRGYTENNDNDIQSIIDDELLPVKDKPLVPEDFYLLKGVVKSEKETPMMINMDTGLISGNLTPPETEFQQPDNIGSNLMIMNGKFAPVVKDVWDEQISPDQYEITPSGILFKNEPYPSGALIDFYIEGGERYFALAMGDVYDGSNKAFQHVVYSDDEPVYKNSYEIENEFGLITFPSGQPVPSGVNVSYYSLNQNAKMFISEHENWVPPNLDGQTGGHLYMGPDIFRGMKDYPADDIETSGGDIISQGEIPQFVESGYQINFRDGCVSFSDTVDSSVEPVYASYSHLCGVSNVSNQILTREVYPSGAYPSGTIVYIAEDDRVYPGSIGARWIGGNNIYTPRNIYVNGNVFPEIKTVNPYDVLTVKESE